MAWRSTKLMKRMARTPQPVGDVVGDVDVDGKTEQVGLG